MVKQNISLLGATGSIGASTLDLIRLHADKYQIFALSGFSQTQKLFELCQEFRPQMVCVADKDKTDFAKQLAVAKIDTTVVSGQEGLCTIACDKKVDKVVAAIVGAAGLISTFSAIKAGKTVLLANKESLVMAGDLMMQTAKQSNATILPIDSEHNAIFQCLPKTVQENNTHIHNLDLGIKKLWLTASGGSFLYKSYEQMQAATVAQAVKHPNWSMGQKISIDSSTMMNKGLELIEACHLFNLNESKIDIAIHPQSIIHSLVEYIDGSLLAQCGTPDMKTPIAHALAYPKRIQSGVMPLNLFDMAQLEFIAPNIQKFKCLMLAREAIKTGNGACIVLNAVNEVAVLAFLQEKIALTDIADVVEASLNHQTLSSSLCQTFNDLDDILAFDKHARLTGEAIINSKIK